MSDEEDGAVLGTGAYGDPANPAESRKAFESRSRPATDPVVVPDPPSYNDDSDDDD